MQVTWERMWPRWVGVACTVFGFANVIGAVADASRMTFPGIVIGGVWAAVGLKGGLPLFGATHADAAQSERVAEGLRSIRRRRRYTFMSSLAWLPLAVLILPRVPEKLLPTFLLLTALPLIATFSVWGLSACPRCGR